MELKNFSENEIIERKEMFSNRLNELMEDISAYLEFPELRSEDEIKEKYKKLKNEIREEAKYLDCIKNRISRISNVHNAYEKGILGASAYGFTVKSNEVINRKMFSSVEEAYYRLNKFFPI